MLGRGPAGPCPAGRSIRCPRCPSTRVGVSHGRASATRSGTLPGPRALYILASGVFESDDDGRGMVIAETVPLVHQESAYLGADNCPEDAITVIDD